VKLLIAVLQPEAAGRAADSLVAGGFGVTKLPTAGGFLRQGNVTLLAGVEDDRADAAIEVVRLACGRPADGTSRSGPLFVLPVVRALKF
jgi:uncharacterized protein YaaQ